MVVIQTNLFVRYTHKAYVKGFEIDKIGKLQILLLKKARTTAEVSNASTPRQIRHKLKINIWLIGVSRFNRYRCIQTSIKLYDRGIWSCFKVLSGGEKTHIGLHV